MDKLWIVCLQVNDDEVILVGAYEDNEVAKRVASDTEFATQEKHQRAYVSAWLEPVPFYGRKE